MCNSKLTIHQKWITYSLKWCIIYRFWLSMKIEEGIVIENHLQEIICDGSYFCFHISPIDDHISYHQESAHLGVHARK